MNKNLAKKTKEWKQLERKTFEQRQIGPRRNEIQAYPLTAQKLYEHLCGITTLGTYVQRPNGTVRYIVTDIDVSKKVLLQRERGFQKSQSVVSSSGSNINR